MKIQGTRLGDGSASGRVWLLPEKGLLASRAANGFAGPSVWAAPSVESIHRGLAQHPPPAAIVLGAPEWSGVGPGVPGVGGVDLDLLRDGEDVTVDGPRAAIELPGVGATEVITAFLQRPDGRILLLKRSDRVGSFQGRWAAVSGFLEDPTPLGQAYREIEEETGIGRSQVDLESSARPIYAREGDRIYVVHPFRFLLPTPVEIHLDWEHAEYEWVDPAEIARRITVPKLGEAWRKVSPGHTRTAKD